MQLGQSAAFYVNGHRVFWENQEIRVGEDTFVGDMTIQVLLEQLLGRQAGWDATWTTEVGIEEMLDMPVRDAVHTAKLGLLLVQGKNEESIQ